MQWLSGTVRDYAWSLLGTAVPALISDLARTSDGLGAFRVAFLAERRANCAEVIERGVARGNLQADLDVDLFMDTLAGAVFYRQVVSAALVDAAIAERVVGLLLPVSGGARQQRGDGENDCSTDECRSESVAQERGHRERS